MVYDIVKDNVPYKQFRISAEELKQQMLSPKYSEKENPTPTTPKEQNSKAEKLTVDLHIEELLDSTTGMPVSLQ